MFPSRPRFYLGLGNLVIAVKGAILLGIRATRSIGIWPFYLDALAFETYCFHQCILLSLVIFA